MTTTIATRSAPKSFHIPVLGSLPEVARLGILPFLERERRKFGDYFRVQMGPRTMFIVAHPDGVERVLGAHRDNYVKAATYDGIRLLTGDGLLTLEGEAWRARRRLENPAFHRDSVRRFVQSMSTITRQAIAAWRWKIPNGGTLDMHHEMMRLTLEIVAETLFGQRLGESVGDSSGKAFGDALELVSKRGNSPVQLPLKIPTPGNLRLKKALASLDAEVFRVLAKARGESREGASPTLLEMLLHARDADTGNALSDRSLRDEVITLFLAGHETTALTMSWAFTLLAQQPEVVAKAREEVARVLGDREPTAEDVPKLVYVRQVIDEVLRLRPPAWATARDTVQDDVIGGYHVPAGSITMPVIYLVHRHPDFWENPDRFDPERFAPERAKSRHHWAYLPFSLGPRICIGNVFALTEAVVLLSMLLQHIEFSMDDPRSIVPEGTVTLRPSGPVPVKVRWRH